MTLEEFQEGGGQPPTAEPGQKPRQEVRPTVDEKRDDSVNKEAVIQRASRELGFIRYPGENQ